MSGSILSPYRWQVFYNGSPASGAKLYSLIEASSHGMAWPWGLCSSIRGLFVACGPSAVLWRVIAVVVDAVNRVLCGRAFAHIEVERCEGLAPAFTDGYSASSVVLPSGEFSIRAPRFNGSPDAVFSLSASEMLRRSFRAAFLMKTTTTSGGTTPQRAAIDRFDTAAVTAADPRCLPSKLGGYGRSGDDNQASETTTD